jgi:hypothetical protein
MYTGMLTGHVKKDMGPYLNAKKRNFDVLDGMCAACIIVVVIHRTVTK